MYKSDYFKLFDLVPRKMYKKFKSRNWQFFDDRLLRLADYLQNRYGEIILNTWKYFESEGAENRVLRSIFYKSKNPFDQHKFGRALDFTCTKEKIDNIREDIVKNYEEFPFMNTMKIKDSVIHLDGRQHGQDGLLILFEDKPSRIVKSYEEYEDLFD